jgi:hypothetical protein
MAGGAEGNAKNGGVCRTNKTSQEAILSKNTGLLARDADHSEGIEGHALDGGILVGKGIASDPRAGLGHDGIGLKPVVSVVTGDTRVAHE